jgi:hypothetical protein
VHHAHAEAGRVQEDLAAVAVPTHTVRRGSWCGCGCAGVGGGGSVCVCIRGGGKTSPGANTCGQAPPEAVPGRHARVPLGMETHRSDTQNEMAACCTSCTSLDVGYMEGPTQLVLLPEGLPAQPERRGCPLLHHAPDLQVPVRRRRLPAVHAELAVVVVLCTGAGARNPSVSGTWWWQGWVGGAGRQAGSSDRRAVVAARAAGGTGHADKHTIMQANSPLSIPATQRLITSSDLVAGAQRLPEHPPSPAAAAATATTAAGRLPPGSPATHWAGVPADHAAAGVSGPPSHCGGQVCAARWTAAMSRPLLGSGG